MADFWDFLLVLLVLLAAAMTLGTIMERLRQSAVLGYMLAGAILGPYAVGLVPDDETIHLMAELGVALLLFSIGLEFNLAELRSLGVRPLVGGALQIIFTTLVVAGLATLAGLDTRPAIGVGIIVSMSSTEVVLSALSRRAETDSLHGRFALAVLLFQDVAVVPAVLLVTALASDGTAGDVAKGTGLSLLLIVGFIIAFFLISKFLLPHIVRFAAAARNREFGVIFALVAGLGSAWVAHALHLSPALGAFIAGVFLGESVIATQLRGDVTPFRTIFVTLFFATIGTFADLQWIAGHAWQVALATAGVMAGKAIIVWLTGATLGMPHRHAAAAGVCIAQMGVFSFVLLQIAKGGKLIDSDDFNLLISTAIASLFATPYLVKLGPSGGAWWELQLRRLKLVRRDTPPDKADPVQEGHVILVGYGPAGRAVDEALRAVKVPVTLIDLNITTVMEARAGGRRAYVGDAANEDTLEMADLPNARAVVVTLPDPRVAAEAVRMVRSHCGAPITVIARARYHRYRGELENAGAHVVVDEEEAVGAQLADALRKSLAL